MMTYMFLQAFSYYGLSCILAVYFHQTLNFSQPSSEAFVHWFICATFVFSMIGGFVADKFLGKVRMILLAGGLWICGSGLLIWATWPGLTTVCVSRSHRNSYRSCCP
jgi:POT family proton-dependent oligopeptide transporter